MAQSSSQQGHFGIIREISDDNIVVVDKSDTVTEYKISGDWTPFIEFLEKFDEVYIEDATDGMIDDSSKFVINPRYLVSVTETIKAISCPRKVYVRHMGASSTYDPYLHQRQVKGNLLHDVFTYKLVHGSSIQEAIDVTLENNSVDLILADFDKNTARKYLKEDAMQLQAFTFDGKSELSVKNYSHGLSGKLDGITSTNMIIELKSSKIPDTTPWPDHNIQMNIYQEMMENYLTDKPKGKVLYISDSQFSIKNPTEWDNHRTIVARNWAYLVLSGKYIPDILRGEAKKACRNCYRKEGCFQLCADLIQQRDCEKCYHNTVCHKTGLPENKIDFFDVMTKATILEELEMKSQEYFGHRYSFMESDKIDKINGTKIKENKDPYGNFIAEYSHSTEDTRFRTGDLITIFPPDVQKETEISFTGRIIDITSKTILLLSGNSLPDEVDVLPSTTSALTRRNRESLYKSIQSSSKIIKLILSIITKNKEVSLPQLEVSNTSIQNPIIEYNEEQISAIKNALNTPDLYLIQGPAGTGKTSVIVEIIHQLVLRERSILVSAFTNMAVDNVGLQLHEAGIKFIRLGSKHRMNRVLHPYSIEENDRAFKEFSENRKGKVILATTSTIGKNVYDDLFFDYVVIDEAAQMKVPDTFAALLHGERAVLVGDHAQLQPIITSEEASSLGFDKSLFERLVKINSRFILLKQQYRMSDEILKFPNQLFYDNKLISANKNIAEQSIAISSDLLSSHSYQVIEIIDDQHNVYSQSNDLEALITIKLISDLTSSEKYDSTNIGVICPFRAQVALLRQYLPEFKIDTIDRFQGSEADIIIFNSTTMVDIPLLSDPRRINVALTRAKQKLIILQTNPSRQKQTTLMSKVYHNATNRNLITNVNKEDLNRIEKEIEPFLDDIQSSKFEYSSEPKIDLQFPKLIYYNSIPLLPVKMNETKRCMICYETIQVGLRCPGCGYLFHQKDLQDWVITNRSCPTCKHRLDLVDIY